MTYVALNTTDFEPRRIFGMSGVLIQAGSRHLSQWNWAALCGYQRHGSRWSRRHNGAASALYDCFGVPITELMSKDIIRRLLRDSERGG